MSVLSGELRSVLERVVVEGRGVAEGAAFAALERLGVPRREAFDALGEGERALRVALRAKGRQLGDPLEKAGGDEDPVPGLVRECAYEHWHQMLFSRFLAENDLLLHPEAKVPVSLAECAELAEEWGDVDGWVVAAEFASAMLPGIFRPDDPLLRVRFAPEDRRALERLVEGLPRAVFVSDDGLGWVYQFWQSKRKDEVNRSGRKIGGDDIAPVTQLFTEHYMVQFLLHNSLGAWWVDRHPDVPLPTDKSYLRTLEDGSPAAGGFEGWPDKAKDLTVMDPCCGSGHFLVAAFALLKRFRMIEEGLSEAEAGDAVLRENLFGLEIDARCTQLAAFNLALEAWKSGGYRVLPALNIACTGINVGGSEGEWTGLTEDPRAKKALSRLFHMFRNASDLGSLIDPTRLAEDDPLYTAGFGEVKTLLDKALAKSDVVEDPVRAVFGEAAKGVARAADLLSRKYWLVPTNVPYLTSVKHGPVLRDVLAQIYVFGKADLATVFLQRAVSFAAERASVALVLPQNWLFLGSYETLREYVLEHNRFNLIARIGENGFSSAQAAGAFVALHVMTCAANEPGHMFSGLDVGNMESPQDKEIGLLREPAVRLEQSRMTMNPDSRIILERVNPNISLLSDYADSFQGICSGDYARFGRYWWELPRISDGWTRQQSSVTSTKAYGGRDSAFLWEGGEGEFREFLYARLGDNHGAWVRGLEAWGRKGVAISQTRDLKATLYLGDLFDNNAAVIVPHNVRDLAALWAYCSSPSYHREVRKIDKKLNVTNLTLIKVPFDIEHWRSVASEEHPDGLPEPFSVDPTQWLFRGAVSDSTEPLQVAVARLVGFVWPDQGKSSDAHPFPEWERDLDELVDSDGVVCLPAVAGERPAVERLRALLARAFGDAWSAEKERELLEGVEYGGRSLEDWLWYRFFKDHVKLFNNRPFVWHVTDGEKDGFSALVNYHRLDQAMLERLIFTYLGDYLRRVRGEVDRGVAGADSRLSAALKLEGKLKSILEGEKPFDIFVRWKGVPEQPLGWDPDLNDGVRLNVRPWVEAGVLRQKFSVHWRKDRGKDPEPNVTGTRERHNDLHFTLEEKRAAGGAAGENGG